MSSVTFCNGSMLLELAKLRLTQKLLRNQTIGPLFARLASYRTFRKKMRRILARPDAVGERELELHWWLISSGDGRLRLPQISSYLDERVRFRGRWIGSLGQLAGVGVPVRVVWARRDPIAVAQIAERVAQMAGTTPRWLEDLGHYPMLEDPQRWAEAILEGLPGR
jgi:pimeloyl-ACP methyl ester carboxylesterase